MGRNPTPVIIGTALLGFLAIGLTLFYFVGSPGNPPEPAQSAATPTPVAVGTHWVAQRTIYPRTIITRDMMIPHDNASTGAPEGAITDPSAVIGRLANRIIYPGETITADAVTSPVARVIPANIPIPMGMRGVAVWVDPDQTEAGLVDVGDRVDVVVTHELKIEKQGPQTIVGSDNFIAGRTIAQDVEVLAVDRSINEYQPATPPPAAGGTAAPANQPGGQTATPTPNATPTPPPAPAGGGQTRNMRVILAVKPADAQRIIAANRMGEIHLTIRNPASHDRFAAAEAHEYPSRVVGSPRPPAASNSGAARPSINREAPPQWPGVQPVSPASVLPSPALSPNPTPQAPDTKDVTVIRGTEKTRAIVPR